MTIRIVFEHSNGMRQIGGTIDFDTQPTLPSHIVSGNQTYALARTEKNYAVYREVAPPIPQAPLL